MGYGSGRDGESETREREVCAKGEESQPLLPQHTLHSPLLDAENNSFAVKT